MSAPDTRFLADESCDFAVVRALRAAGYDVLAVAEAIPSSDDATVIAVAARDHRILITEDKDFGWLVFATHTRSAGVILIRFPGNARATLAQTISVLVQQQGEALLGAFCVVQPGHIRISRKPDLQP